MRKRNIMKKIIIILGIIVVCIPISLVFVFAVLNNSNKREIIATITEKTVKNNGDVGKYLVFTKDNEKVEVYAIQDELFQGRWNSSDTYGKIEAGKKYKFTVVGIRNRFFSLYPNILEAEEILEENDAT